jgi:hypothetical protein
MIDFTCPACNALLRHGRPGAKIFCACGQRVQVPGAGASPHTVLGEPLTQFEAADDAEGAGGTSGARIFALAAIGILGVLVIIILTIMFLLAAGR